VHDARKRQPSNGQNSSILEVKPRKWAIFKKEDPLTFKIYTNAGYVGFAIDKIYF